MGKQKETNVTAFAEKVYAAVSRIPAGRVATYGQIAELVGKPGGARAVGNALHVNPFAPVVPCHRVVAADGSLAAHFGCPGGPAVQYERLRAEGVTFLSVPSLSNAAQGDSETPDKSKRDSSTFPKVDLSRCGIVIESHPLEPFLPSAGRILFLGSFPPPKERWSMEFFYPNWINDFWRIQGMIHFGDAHHFEKKVSSDTEAASLKSTAADDGKNSSKRSNCFDRDRIIDFCNSRGLAFYDTASKVCRLKGNASDEFLEILQPADISSLLAQMPECHTVVTTGGKSSEEFSAIISRLSSVADSTMSSAACRLPLTRGSACPAPAVGAFVDVTVAGRAVRWWRMPSTSRAYPMSLASKAAHYAKLF